MQAILYVRWSTKDQSKGDSERRQTDLASSQCKHRGWTLTETLIENGKSAYHGRNRAAGGKLFEIEERAARGELAGKVLLVEAMDRLSRQEPLESVTLLNTLAKQGLTICETSTGTVYDAERIRDHWAHLLIAFARAGEAHDSSRLKAKRVSGAWRRTQETGKTKAGTDDPRLCPAWMEVVDGKFTPVAERAEVIRSMFQMARDGKGYRAIADWAKTERDRMGWPKRTWDIRGVCIQLADRRVLGEYRPQMRTEDGRANVGEPIELYPAIVEETLWHRTRASIDSRKNTGGQQRAKCVNLLSHLARCTYRNEGSNVPCGSKMVMRTQKSGYSQITCSSFARAADCRCNATYHYNHLLAGIFEHVLPIAARVVFQPTDEGQTKIALLKAELASKRARLEEMAERLIEEDDDVMMRAYQKFKQRVADDAKALKEMDTGEQKAAATLTPAQLAQHIEELKGSLDTPEGRQKMQTYLDQLIDAINMDSTDRSATIIMAQGRVAVKLDKRGKLIGTADALMMEQARTYVMSDGSKQTFDPRPADRNDYAGDVVVAHAIDAVRAGALRSR